jgi:hypothetical protein
MSLVFSYPRSPKRNTLSEHPPPPPFTIRCHNNCKGVFIGTMIDLRE